MRFWTVLFSMMVSLSAYADMETRSGSIAFEVGKLPSGRIHSSSSGFVDEVQGKTGLAIGALLISPKSELALHYIRQEASLHSGGSRLGDIQINTFSVAGRRAFNWKNVRAYAGAGLYAAFVYGSPIGPGYEASGSTGGLLVEGGARLYLTRASPRSPYVGFNVRRYFSDAIAYIDTPAGKPVSEVQLQRSEGLIFLGFEF
ncbi:hypothetical protein KW797_00670 [Candidatus Parcubacteria bacterium]|nr:hypothetical protein [Candidatus Parcubacteria bacterium]